MRYGKVFHKQAVGIFVLLCIRIGGCHLRRERVCIHYPGVGKGNIVQRCIRQAAVRRAGNAHCRQIEIVSAAGNEVKLLVGGFLYR